jgi:hypothetical protein
MLTVLAGILGLIGGFLLRYVVVAGGVKSPLNGEGILIFPPDVVFQKASS